MSPCHYRLTLFQAAAFNCSLRTYPNTFFRIVVFFLLCQRMNQCQYFLTDDNNRLHFPQPLSVPSGTARTAGSFSPSWIFSFRFCSSRNCPPQGYILPFSSSGVDFQILRNLYSVMRLPSLPPVLPSASPKAPIPQASAAVSALPLPLHNPPYGFFHRFHKLRCFLSPDGFLYRLFYFIRNSVLPQLHNKFGKRTVGSIPTTAFAKFSFLHISRILVRFHSL